VNNFSKIPMNWFKQLLAYPLVSLGALFLIAAICVPFDNDTPKDEVPETIVGCLFISAVTFASGGGLLRSSQGQQKQAKAKELEVEQERLRGILYQLIADKQGGFTLVQFAIAADIPPKAAQDFLNQQATAFNANFNVSEQGAVVYQFPIS
jgi:hypothetical protein